MQEGRAGAAGRNRARLQEASPRQEHAPGHRLGKQRTVFGLFFLLENKHWLSLDHHTSFIRSCCDCLSLYRFVFFGTNALFTRIVEPLGQL